MNHDYTECIAGFEARKKFTNEGVEYWNARELMPLLAYTDWKNFQSVIEKARAGAKSASAPVDHHFSETGNMVQIGSGAERERADWYLSRYACYLIAMNADSGKPEVGHAMTYFAIQTRRQEMQDKALAEAERLRLRLRVMDNNHRLFATVPAFSE